MTENSPLYWIQVFHFIAPKLLSRSVDISLQYLSFQQIPTTGASTGPFSSVNLVGLSHFHCGRLEGPKNLSLEIFGRKGNFSTVLYSSRQQKQRYQFSIIGLTN